MTKNYKKKRGVLKTPSYPGGRKAMNEFIRAQLKYPKEALEQKIEGKVVVKFKLNEDGDVIEKAIHQSIGYGCDKEALRVVQLLNFSGVKNRGVKVTFSKTISIPFKLPKIPKKKAVQVIYNVAPSTSSQKSTDSKVTYTIKINKKK